MKNSENKNIFKFKPNKEYLLFGMSVFIILFVIFKFSLFYYYNYQANQQFIQKTECNTYKTIYISELKNGNSEKISIIIKEAKNENCINTTSDEKSKNKNNKINTNVQKDDSEKVYNSVDVHEAKIK